MNMETFGYVSVSKKEQNEARQLIAMEEFGVTPENIYIDKQSGKDLSDLSTRNSLAS